MKKYLKPLGFALVLLLIVGSITIFAIGDPVDKSMNAPIPGLDTCLITDCEDISAVQTGYTLVNDYASYGKVVSVAMTQRPTTLGGSSASDLGTWVASPEWFVEGNKAIIIHAVNSSSTEKLYTKFKFSLDIIDPEGTEITVGAYPLTADNLQMYDKNGVEITGSIIANNGYDALYELPVNFDGYLVWKLEDLFINVWTSVPAGAVYGNSTYYKLYDYTAVGVNSMLTLGYSTEGGATLYICELGYGYEPAVVTTEPPTTTPPTTAPPTTPPTEPPTTAPPTTTPVGPKSLISDGDMATSGALGTTEWKTLTNGDTDVSFRFISYLGGGDNGGALLFKRNSYSDYLTYSCVYQDIPVSEFDSGSYVLRAYLRGYQIEAYQKASETAKGSRLFVQYLDANNNVLNQIDGERLPYGADETAWKLYSVTFNPKSSAGAVSVRVGFISYQLICETAIDGVSLVKASDSAPAYSTAAPVQTAAITDSVERNPFSAETLAPTPTVTRGTVPPSPAPTTPSPTPSSGTATIPPSGTATATATAGPDNSNAPATGERNHALPIIIMCAAALIVTVGVLLHKIKVEERDC